LKFEKIHIDRQELILHTIFWLAWIISFTAIQSVGSETNTWFMWLVYYVITLPIFIAHTYLIAYWLFPKLFFKGQYIYFIAGFLLFLVLFSVIELIVSNEIVFKHFDPNKAFSPGYLNLANILISGVGNLYIVLVFLAIKVGRSWYSTQNLQEELMLTKLETDLEIYRNQLQPKLIYSLMDELEIITVQKPEKAPEMIVKISSFLNHFLFEGKEELLPLSLESKLIEEFLEIHKQALENRLVSNFIVNGLLKSFVVPPLLLLPFINSAIKLVYECNNSFESTVIIKAEKKYLLFSFTFWSETEFRLSDNENIKITKKRLNYSYPGKHRLIENIDENFREVSLEIFS
jgi:two-component system, LytTR family, sensor kinase